MEKIILSQTTKDELVQEILIGIQSILQESTQLQRVNQEWLTSKEVQEMLSISHVTLWKYDNEGITNPRKIGSRKRYKYSEIQNILSLKKIR